MPFDPNQPWEVPNQEGGWDTFWDKEGGAVRKPEVDLSNISEIDALYGHPEITKAINETPRKFIPPEPTTFRRMEREAELRGIAEKRAELESLQPRITAAYEQHKRSKAQELADIEAKYGPAPKHPLSVTLQAGIRLEPEEVARIAAYEEAMEKALYGQRLDSLIASGARLEQPEPVRAYDSLKYDLKSLNEKEAYLRSEEAQSTEFAKDRLDEMYAGQSLGKDLSNRAMDEVYEFVGSAGRAVAKGASDVADMAKVTSDVFGLGTEEAVSRLYGVDSSAMPIAPARTAVGDAAVNLSKAIDEKANRVFPKQLALEGSLAQGLGTTTGDGIGVAFSGYLGGLNRGITRKAIGELLEETAEKSGKKLLRQEARDLLEAQASKQGAKLASETFGAIKSARSGYYDAKEAGRSDADALKAAASFVGAGLSDSLPIFKMFDKVSPESRRTLVQMAADIGMDGAKKGSKEVLEASLEEMAAMEFIDENRDSLFEILKSGGSGTFQGILLGRISDAAKRGRTRRRDTLPRDGDLSTDVDLRSLKPAASSIGTLPIERNGDELRAKGRQAREEYERIAPGAAETIPLSYIEPEFTPRRLRESGKLGPGKDVAWDEANSRVLMLRDTLRSKSNNQILWSQLRGLAQAHLSMVPESVRNRLMKDYSREIQNKSGPLFQEGRPLFAGKEITFEDWYAERTLRENRNWAKRRRDVTAHDGTGIGLAAAHFRKKYLYPALGDFDRQFGDETGRSFREFLRLGPESGQAADE